MARREEPSIIVKITQRIYVGCVILFMLEFTVKHTIGAKYGRICTFFMFVLGILSCIEGIVGLFVCPEWWKRRMIFILALLITLLILFVINTTVQDL